MADTLSSLWWQDHAACAAEEVDHNWFFQERTEKGGLTVWQQQQTAKALAVCARCPVRETCYEYAIENDMRWGVWGGVTQTARNKEAQLRRRKERNTRAT